MVSWGVRLTWLNCKWRFNRRRRRGIFNSLLLAHGILKRKEDEAKLHSILTGLNVNLNEAVFKGRISHSSGETENIPFVSTTNKNKEPNVKKKKHRNLESLN